MHCFPDFMTNRGFLVYYGQILFHFLTICVPAGVITYLPDYITINKSHPQYSESTNADAGVQLTSTKPPWVIGNSCTRWVPESCGPQPRMASVDWLRAALVHGWVPKSVQDLKSWDPSCTQLLSKVIILYL